MVLLCLITEVVFYRFVTSSQLHFITVVDYMGRIFVQYQVGGHVAFGGRQT